MSDGYIWRDPRRYAIFATIPLCIQITMRLTTSALLFGQMTIWQNGTAPPSLVDGLNIAVRTTNIIVPLSFILGAIAAGFWTYQASVNAHFFNRRMTSKAWVAVVSYLIPLGNLFVPCFIMLEIWDISSAYSKRSGGRGLVQAWWLVFWTANLAAAAEPVIAMDNAARPLRLLLAINLLFILSALLFIGVVWKITGMQVGQPVAQVFGARPEEADDEEDEALPPPPPLQDALDLHLEAQVVTPTRTIIPKQPPIGLRDGPGVIHIARPET